MQIILLEKIKNLGNVGEIVETRPGFSRNFLISKNKALRATSHNIKYIQEKEKVFKEKYVKQKEIAKFNAKKIKNKLFIIARQASRDGKLYGSIRKNNILKTLLSFNKNIKKISLQYKIKKVGIYNIVVNLHPEVDETVQLIISRTKEEAKKIFEKKMKTGDKND